MTKWAHCEACGWMLDSDSVAWRLRIRWHVRAHHHEVCVGAGHPGAKWVTPP